MPSAMPLTIFCGFSIPWPECSANHTYMLGSMQSLFSIDVTQACMTLHRFSHIRPSKSMKIINQEVVSGVSAQ